MHMQDGNDRMIRQVNSIVAAAANIQDGSRHFDALRSILLPQGRPYPPLPAQLTSVFPSVLNLASIASDKHKIFVLDFIEKASLRDIKIYPAASTETLDTLLHDKSPSVVRCAIRALTVLFRRICGFATVYPKFPITAWHAMQRYVTRTLIDSSSASVRYSAMKFSEMVLLSFSSSPGRASPDHFTLETLSLPSTRQNPDVTIEKLEGEGLSVARRVSMVLLGTSDPLMVTIAIDVLSSVARRRPSMVQETIVPLYVLATRLEQLPGRGISNERGKSIAITLRLHLNAFSRTLHGKTRSMKKKITAAVGSIGGFLERNDRKRGRASEEEAFTNKRGRWIRASILPSKRESEIALRYFINTKPPIALVDLVLEKLHCSLPQNTPVQEAPKEEVKTVVKSEKSIVEPKEVQLAARGSRKQRLTAPAIVAPKLSLDRAVKLVQFSASTMLRRNLKVIHPEVDRLRIELLGRVLPIACVKSGVYDDAFAIQCVQWITHDLSSRFVAALVWLFGESARELFQSEASTITEEPSSSLLIKGKAAELPSTIVKEENVEDLADQKSVEVADGPSSRDADSDKGVEVNQSKELAFNNAEEENVEFDGEVIEAVNVEGNYRKLFEMMEEEISQVDISGVYLGSLYLRAPVIPQSCTSKFISALENPASSTQALRLSRVLLLQRPSVRSWLLPVILERAVRTDPVVRGPAIRLISTSLFTLQPSALRNDIQDFVLSVIKSTGERLLSPKTDVLPLLLALAEHSDELFSSIIDLYRKADGSSKRRILQGIPHVATQIGPSTTLINTVTQKDEAIKELTLCIIQSAASFLKMDEKSLNDFVKVVDERYEEEKDTRIILPILRYLSRERLKELLPALTESKFDMVVRETTPSIFQPEELLKALHEMPPSLNVENAIASCLKQKAIFTQELVATALESLITFKKNSLCLRTVLLAMKEWPKLEKFVLGIVAGKVVQEKIWKKESIWKDCITFCEAIGENCLIIINKLPSKILDDVLQQSPLILERVRSVFADAAKAKRKVPTKYRKWIATS